MSDTFQCHYCNLADTLPGQNACASCDEEWASAEVFYAHEGELPSPESDPGREMMAGFYWKRLGCDPVGPFNNRAEALADSER